MPQIWTKFTICILGLAVASTGAQARAQRTGPSSSASSYLLPTNSEWKTTSILTAGDSIGGYKMVGIPDGLGAYDNGDGTITVLMNHELPATAGVARDHGGTGAFVSSWVIDKSTLKVISGQDLVQTVTTGGSLNFNRFCSADLPAESALYDAGSGLGTQNKLFLNGEESSGGRAMATVVTGADAGHAYELTAFGGHPWENLLANPGTGSTTLVAATSDSNAPDGKIYFYQGTKTAIGTDVEKAGLTGGTLSALKVDGLAAPGETRAFGLSATTETYSAHFTLDTPANGTSFLRPEDGAWDPNHPNDFYFVTTDRLDTHDAGGTQAGNSRLWVAHFDDIAHPELGGTITALLTGISADPNNPDLSQPNMMDNITIDGLGHVFIQEDVGNAAHNGKVWEYDIATGKLTQILMHDPARFGNIGLAATAPFTQDEESSGIIDVSSLFGRRTYLLDVQAHYPNGSELVEGGQLVFLQETPEPASLTLAVIGIASVCVGVRAKRKVKA